MATIDVSVETEIVADPTDVASIMFDPQRDPEWMQVVTGVELVDQALTPGARVRRRGSVMGKEFAWTTEVEAVHFPHLLTVRIAGAPFEGTIRYDIQRSAGGSRVRIRGTADPAMGLLPVSIVEEPLRTFLTADLARLKALVEKK